MTEEPISSAGRRPFAFAVGAIILAILSIAVCVFPPQSHSKPLRVGFNEFSPYIAVNGDGKPAGLAVEVINEAARRSGLNISWRAVEDGEKALREGTIDVYPLMTVTRERQNKFHFSDYWWQNNLELVSSQQRPVRRVADAAGRKIGLTKQGAVVNSANGLLPGATLIVKPTTEALVDALCRGEIDAVFGDLRSIQHYLVDRPPLCWSLKAKIISVAGARQPMGTASTRLARNRADVLFTHINEVLADGTLANLACTYAIPTPDSNQQLAQLQQHRQYSLWLEGACLGLCCLLVASIFVSARMRAAQRDIEDAHMSLEESEQRFHAFMDHLAANAFMKDQAGRMVYVNKADATMFDLPPEEILGKTNFDLMPAPAAEQLWANDRMVLESNRAHQFTESLPDRAGNMHHWLSFKFPFYGRAGQVFLGGVSIEVTEMVKVQNALRESESRYRQIVEFAGDIIVRCDAGGRVSYINEMGARVLRISADKLRGRRALSVIRRKDRKRIVDGLRRELAEGVTDLYIEVPVVTGDGSELWLGQTIRVMRTGTAINGFQAISRDITERRRIEAELRSSEERFRLLYENGPVAYHEIDRQGLIQRVNRAESELLGIAESELIGRPAQELLVPEEREISKQAITAKITEQIPLCPFNRTFLRSDGRRVRVEIHEKLLRDRNGGVIGIHSVLLDVTQRHLAETMDHDRRELSEMIAQQQPLDRILHGISRMIGHYDQTLCCIPLRLLREERRLEPVVSGDNDGTLCRAIRELGNEAFRLWPSHGFRVSQLNLRELLGNPAAASPPGERANLAAAAIQMGMASCWWIPIISSSQTPLGMLLVFSRRIAEATAQERQLLESASRVAAVGIENRYLTDLMAFQASHDSLTRLPNRSSFDERLEDAIAHAHAQGEQLAVFYIDLDRFKAVNDTFGHSGGDGLLQQVALRLRKCIRETDLLARIGGDEFSLLLPGLRDTRDANRVAESILQAFRAPFDIDGSEVHITSSIGISFYPKDGLDATTLQRKSDGAMYRVKNTGKNSFRCCPGDTRQRVDRMVSPGRVA